MDQQSQGLDSVYDLEFYKTLTGKKAENERIQNGRLPIIDIAGHPFFVHVRSGLLQPMGNFHTMGISIEDKPMHPETKKLSFYYHIPSMTEVTIDPGLTALPENVVKVVLPNKHYLDPIGMAREEGRQLDYYLHGYIPLRMYRKAQIIPLKKTELPALIQRNLKNAPVNQAAVPQRRKIKQTRKGRGL